MAADNGSWCAKSLFNLAKAGQRGKLLSEAVKGEEMLSLEGAKDARPQTRWLVSRQHLAVRPIALVGEAGGPPGLRSVCRVRTWLGPTASNELRQSPGPRFSGTQLAAQGYCLKIHLPRGLQNNPESVSKHELTLV